MALKEFKINSQSLIDRKQESTAMYLRSISNYEQLSAEEEVELAQTIHKGGKEGEAAKKRLVEANLRFVVSVANGYKQKGFELLDLIEEGNIGLLHAAERFDETRGFKFISFAVWWIRQSILNALGDQRHIIRLPQNQQKILAEYKAMQQEVMHRENRPLTIDEFCDATDYEPNRIQEIIKATSKVIDMDAPFGLEEDSDTSFGDMMASDSKTDHSLDKESLHSELFRIFDKILTDRERTIVEMRYGFNREQLSFEEIALRVGLSRERTRQICKDAIEKIKTSPCSRLLIPYLAA